MLLFSLAVVATSGMYAAMPNAEVSESAMHAENCLLKYNQELKVSNLAPVSFNESKSKRNAALKETETVVVSYRRPVGTFYWAPNYTTGSVYGLISAPAYKEITWLNTTTGVSDLSGSIWKVQPSSTTTTTAQDFSSMYYGVTAAGYAYDTPVLNVNGTEFQLGYTTSTGTARSYGFQAGREAAIDGVSLGFAPLSYFDVDDNFRARYFGYPSEITNTTTGETSDQYWAKKGKLASGNVIGYCQEYEKPASPYVLHNVRLYSYLQADAGTKLSIVVYKITDEGMIGDALSTSTITIDNATTAGAKELLFPVTGVDPVTGFDTDNLIVSSGIIVMVTGFKDNASLKSFYPIINAVESKKANRLNEFNAYVAVMGLDANGAEKVAFPNIANIAYYMDNNVDVEFCTSYVMALEAEFPFICAVSDENGTDDVIFYTASSNGEQKDYYLDASVKSAELVVSEANDGEMPTWISPNLSDFTDTDGSEYSLLSFTVQALPNDLNGRTASIKVDSNGATKIFTISQGTGSVGTNVVNGTIKVTTVNGNFEIVNPTSATNAKVYNVAGLLVKDVNLDAVGTTIIDGKDLAKGLYILKFNNNFTVKVVK